MTTYSGLALSSQLRRRLAESRDETDRLFAIIKPAHLYERPIAERHRIVFYIGHLEAFDWNLLRGLLKVVAFHAEFDRLFAFGIDPVDGGLPTDQASEWPSLNEIEGYRRRVRLELDSALAEAVENEELVQAMHIAIEHRLMHAETLEYMLHQLPFDAKVRPDLARPELFMAPASRAMPEMIPIPGGAATLGLKREPGQFGWDNEFESHTAEVPAFSIDRHKVTNGEFVRFVQAGGYTERDLWTPADWSWISEAGIPHPALWIKSADGFRYRAMFDDIPLALDAPVYVSHAEASAYARWVGKALPSEAEWQRASEGAQPPKETRKLWDAPAAGSSPELRSTHGVEDLLGTGWEWTSSAFAPFPGFKIFPSYPGYSADFFDGKHFVMKGGSTRTAACMLRMSFRNWFQAHYQFVYAGFRCVAH
jgi:ergothioneine biosynthesis protein EgtB